MSMSMAVSMAAVMGAMAAVAGAVGAVAAMVGGQLAREAQKLFGVVLWGWRSMASVD